MTLTQIEKRIQAKVVNADQIQALAQMPDASFSVRRIASLKEAKSDELAFFFSKHYQNDLVRTNAAVIVTGNDFVEPLQKSGIQQWKKSIFLACADPYRAMALLSADFSKIQSAHDHQNASTQKKIHSTAVVSPTAKIGEGVQIGAHVVIEDGVEIGPAVVLYPHCYLGKDSKVGEGSVLFPRVTLYERTEIGKRCRIHAGTVIGSDGFGYAPIFNPSTRLPEGHEKIYHLGNVVIGDEVEIGANSTIDRGTLGPTTIHSKAKIDNLVQIAHNCEVGEGAILCGGAALSGSSSLGKYVTIGGHSGPANQVHIGDYAKLNAFTGAAKDVPAHAEMAGIPARPLSDQYRIWAIQSKLLKERGKK